MTLAACLAVLGLAATLTPDARGMGTHQALGLAPCNLLETTGLPCPTCGMTTAFAHAAHGQLLQALWAQPAGALFALMVAAMVLLCAYALVTGLCLSPLLQWFAQPAPVLTGMGLVLAAWVYKIVLVCR